MSNRILAGCALAIALAAAPAQAQLAAAPAPLNPPVKLTVGAVKVPHVAPFSRVADLARPLGVEVEMVNFVRYADVRTALASGSIEVGSIGPADVPIAVSQNLRGIVGLFGVGVSAKHPIVRNGVTLNSWEELYGKRVAIAPGSAVWFQFAATVTEANINYGRLNIVNIQGGGQPFVQAMQRGDIDLFIGWEPFESMAIQQGLGTRQTALDYSKSKAVGAELGMVGATRAAIENKREALRRLVYAYLQAQAEMSASKEALGNAIAAWTGLDAQVARAVANDMTLEQSLTLAQIQAQAKEFHRLGVLQRDVSGEMAQFFDESIIMSVRR
ncbi:ABC transporter substrate-binding protein [Elioraea rosea]|uniref:ABC transporter substrate-binding protein n=1 Tax=Elioraea rosea TaxID=2492390 RepID=UPI001182594A|nr:ABC transporter substrate-binding protein [Elioraea rosea]